MKLTLRLQKLEQVAATLPPKRDRKDMQAQIDAANALPEPERYNELLRLYREAIQETRRPSERRSFSATRFRRQGYVMKFDGSASARRRR